MRPLLALILLVTAAASYYMDRDTVYMDRPMLANVFATNYKEVRELLGLGMAVHVLVLGALPAALLWWPRLKSRPLARAFVIRAGWVVAAAALGVGSLLLVLADFASLYLHGMPYAIAPSVQTRVPFVLWMSQAFRDGRGIDEQCLLDRAKPEVASHEQLFHSLLGIFGVETSAYDPKLDLFEPCRLP